MATTQFILFKSLPVEARQRVWFWALPSPLVLSLTNKSNSRSQQDQDASPSSLKYALASYIPPPPSMLGVCRESRSVAKMHYQLGFSAIVGQPIYFDFKNDILDCADARLDFSLHCPGVVGDVKKVENVCTSALQWVDEGLVMGLLEQFEGLRKMVADDDDEVLLFPDGMPDYDGFIARALDVIQGMQEDGKKEKRYTRPVVLFRDYSEIQRLRMDATHWHNIVEDKDGLNGDNN
ncbi:hypothetical protein B2J93_7608 [Marssonina coronariae]|uniref:2EXR domain-containing protein n=1 Tax=Diplocarpon coronariae TaxID=2795749 RepID=A0A218Z7J7_9HELO|nr:hypothetical protein B2J93_7608 [Marssonina coronariae]